MSATTILIYGPSSSGKTPQIGLLAEDVFIKTGKKTRLYTADFGGTDTIAPYIDLGIIEVEEIGTSNVWIFLNKAINGWVRGPGGKWVLDAKRNADTGVYAFESAHGLAQLLKMDMEKKAATGVNIGGDTNTSFEIKDDGETLKVGTTKGYQKFGIPQNQVLDAMYMSFRLPAQYIVWTAGIEKGDDDIMIASKVVGPDVIGRALTGVLNKDFNYTIRLGIVPAKDKTPERHIMYLGTHIDPATGNAAALGNIRRPLDAPALKELTVEPANIVTALRLIREQAKEDAKTIIMKRIEAAAQSAKKGA